MAKKQKKGLKRKLFKTLAIVSFVFTFILFGASIALSVPLLKPVSEIRIGGELNRLTTRDVAVLIKDVPRKNYFLMDTNLIYNILQQVPWVSSVDVDRVWPDALEIRVHEHKPVARWHKGGLLNSEGKLFYPEEKSYPKGLPLAAAPQGSEQQVVEILSHISKLSNGKIKLEKIALQGDQWSLQLANSIKLQLGSNYVQQRIRRFVIAYPNLEFERIAGIDLRYANGFAVRWK